jgi:hypothetical protein
MRITRLLAVPLAAIALVAAFAASVGVPLLLWRALMPDTSTRLLAVTAVGAAGVAVLILGVSLF